MPDKPDPFAQAAPSVANDPADAADPYRKPEEHAHEKRPGYERVALWWRTIFPIASFSVGALLLVYQGIIAKSSSPTIIGVGLVLAGLGPAGLIDVIRKIP